MKTKHRKELEKRHKEFIKDKELNIVVVNTKKIDGGMIKIKTLYHSIEEAEHKIALDMMTNAFYGFEEPIEIYIKIK